MEGAGVPSRLDTLTSSHSGEMTHPKAVQGATQIVSLAGLKQDLLLSFVSSMSVQNNFNKDGCKGSNPRILAFMDTRFSKGRNTSQRGFSSGSRGM